MLPIKEEKGAVGLEFTIVFPLLLMMTFGIIEFGILLFDKAILTNATREGTRAAIVYNYEGPPGVADCNDFTQIRDNVRAVVNTYLQSYLINFDPNELVEDDDIDVSVNQVNSEYTLQVRVNYQFHFIAINSIINLLFGNALNNGVALDAFAEMRGEDQTLLEDLLPIYSSCT